jgi:hypothetical protein
MNLDGIYDRRKPLYISVGVYFLSTPIPDQRLNHLI